MSTAAEAVDQTQHTVNLISADDFAEFGGYLAMGYGKYRTCVVIDSDKAFGRFKPEIESGRWFVVPATFIPPTSKTTHGAWTMDMLAAEYGYREIKPDFSKQQHEPRQFFTVRNFTREDRQRGYTVDWKNAESIKQFMVRLHGYTDGLDISSIDYGSGLGVIHGLYDPESGQCHRCEEEGGQWGFYQFIEGSGMFKHGVIAFPVTHGGNTDRLFTADELNIG